MLIDMLRDYQDRNQRTGEHDCPRSADQYARLLGVSAPMLSQVYSGQRNAGGKVIRGFMRAFPSAAADIGRAILDEPTEQATAGTTASTTP